MSQPVRRVVTGHDTEGRAVFVAGPNPGDAPGTLAVFICGAHHAGIA